MEIFQICVAVCKRITVPQNLTHRNISESCTMAQELRSWGSLDLDVGDLDRLVHPLDDARKHLARAKLVAALHACVDELPEGSLPLHRGGHLLGEDLLDDLGVGVGGGIHVGDDGDAGLADLHRVEDLDELRHSWRHEVSVEGTRDSERHGHAGLELGLGELCHLLAGNEGAGDGVVTVAQEVGELDLLSTLLGGHLAERCHLVLAEANDRHHA
mmetsp:Transcript_17860/g.48046  ORF Transcript_17860/g.48046 Transcript_17860/m.48046 type:complete len:214 (-) Transcript_17860:553-1194(-)